MAPFAKISSFMVALLILAATADGLDNRGECAEEHDETSLVQLQTVLRRSGEHAKVTSQNAEVIPEVPNSTPSAALHEHAKFAKTISKSAPNNASEELLLETQQPMNVGDVISSIEHCFQKRGVNLVDYIQKPLDFYMHSGTAVNYLGCRKELNDIDLWFPGMMGAFGKKKIGLLEAYGSGMGVKWDFKKNPTKTPGLTDKGVPEWPDQTYCPEEIVNGKTFKEVDAFVGKGKKFDVGKFQGIASGGMSPAAATLVHQGVGINLYVIGTCSLIELKMALIKPGGRKNPKKSDFLDLNCLCKKRPQMKPGRRAKCTDFCLEYATDKLKYAVAM